MLFDSSIWIDFLNGKQTEKSALLHNEIKEFSNVFICPPVYQEVLQGIVTDADEQVIKLHLDNLTKLIEDAYFVAAEAANLYRSLRIKGITIRKPNDCLIAVYAIKNEIVLLHDDRDFRLIAENTSLRIIDFN